MNNEHTLYVKIWALLSVNSRKCLHLWRKKKTFLWMQRAIVLSLTMLSCCCYWCCCCCCYHLLLNKQKSKSNQKFYVLKFSMWYCVYIFDGSQFALWCNKQLSDRTRFESVRSGLNSDNVVVNMWIFDGTTAENLTTILDYKVLSKKIELEF